ncbi:hypothetical protein [Edaphobacter flagellatus]|uniref:hypothetical protein n=1 Tax=Edaphobacter flagellatus TaxID=1933044 RepID=UPI0021B33466|nr:hypothetical protein [Edaphobacter flagellatus]
MTPPIGFRTNTGDTDSLQEIRPTAILTEADGTAVVSALPTSQFADRAYRIAALTAGIALLASFF